MLWLGLDIRWRLVSTSRRTRFSKSSMVTGLRTERQRLTSMSEVVPNAPQEFWRPPIMVQSSAPPPMAAIGSLVDSCRLCGTEFMAGSGFCYVCGSARGQQVGAKFGGLKRDFGFLRIFGFQHIKQGLGLPVASLVGFLAGIGCLIAALFVGRASSIQNFTEFQAVQLLRIEWLIGAATAFLGAILLKSAGADK